MWKMKSLACICLLFCMSCSKGVAERSENVNVSSSECECIVAFYKQGDNSFVATVILDCGEPGGSEARINLPVGIYIVRAVAAGKSYQSLFQKKVLFTIGICRFPPIGRNGELFGVGGVKTDPDNPRGERSKSVENRCKGKGEWNVYDVVCVDGTIKLSVNGKFVNGIRNSTQRKGYLCLEAEGAQIEMRNFRMIELP